MLFKEISLFKNLENPIKKKIEIFDKRVCSFFSELSDLIFQDPNAKSFPELISYAFFIRANNLKLEKKKYSKLNNRHSIGTIIHFAPKNVPINFAYSLYFGLITGNTNIIKLSSKNYYQVNFILNKLDNILKKNKFSFLKRYIYFVKYNKEDKSLTQNLIEKCDLKVIWGGDQSVKEIRAYDSLPSTLEYTFPDKYSLCLINYNKYKELNSKEVKKLVEKFYNDAYTFDQNACNSPHLIIWIGKSKNKNKIGYFWKILDDYAAKKNNYSKIVISEKFNKLHEDILRFDNINSHKFYSENLCVVSLDTINKNIYKQRGKWGYFYQFISKDLKILNNISSKKMQTITYSGFRKEDFKKFFSLTNIRGIDRVVPIGSGFDMSNVWDGKNFYEIFTRIIDIK